MTFLLAFDTSTDAMSIALRTPQRLLTRDAAGGAQASARLVPDVLALMAEAGCGFAQLDAIAFGCGPGAFTGLRTACSVAQGLAFGAGKPVLPVDSLMLVAQGARHQRGAQGEAAPNDVWVAMDARMDEIYAGAYRWQGGRWAVTVAPALYSVDALNAVWRDAPAACVAGSALGVFGSRLSTGAATLVPSEGSRAAALAEVAMQQWAEGRAVEASQALPVYLRDKVALTTREREAVKLAKEAAA